MADQKERDDNPENAEEPLKQDMDPSSQSAGLGRGRRPSQPYQSEHEVTNPAASDDHTDLFERRISIGDHPTGAPLGRAPELESRDGL